jgi:hypothetical protein
MFLFLISFSTSFPVNSDSGLVAYYPFNGNANDLRGNNNNPVFNTTSLTTDNLGNANSAYHFNGSGTYMMIDPHNWGLQYRDDQISSFLRYLMPL